jgi:hypothetical protein
MTGGTGLCSRFPEQKLSVPVGTGAVDLPSAELPGFVPWVGCFCE